MHSLSMMFSTSDHMSPSSVCLLVITSLIVAEIPVSSVPSLWKDFFSCSSNLFHKYLDLLGLLFTCLSCFPPFVSHLLTTALPLIMFSSSGVILRLEYFDSLKEKYGFQLYDGVVIPLDGSLFSEPPPSKVRIYVKTFDVGYRLLTTIFSNELLQKSRINVYGLTPNFVTKIVAFEMLYRSQGMIRDI